MIFKRHFGTLERLREHFVFSLIDASGGVNDVEKKIKKEFQYQSTLELGEDTYDAIQTVPLVSEIQKNSRQELVRRLDHYQTYHQDAFGRALELIRQEFIPPIKKHANSGSVVIRVQHPDLEENPQSLEMILDVLTERGYYISCDILKDKVPVSVDPKTFKIKHEINTVFKFTISFQRSRLRSEEVDQNLV